MTSRGVDMGPSGGRSCKKPGPGSSWAKHAIDQAVNTHYSVLTGRSMVRGDPIMPGQKATEAARREQILKAAYEVALRRGIDGLTVRAVATRARLSHGLVLFHFKRKDQLGLALLDRVLATTLAL